MKTVLVAVGLALAPMSTAKAEAVNLLAGEYKPLVNTKAGRIEMCGIHYSAVVSTLDQRLLSVQGSVNTSYFEGKIPGLLIKIAVSQAIDKKPTIVPKKVQFALFRIGQQDTRKMTRLPSEDGNSLLLMTDMNQTGEFAFTFPDAFKEGAWVSFSLSQDSPDYSFRLPAFGERDIDTLKQLADCNSIGLDLAMKELQSAEQKK